jgi:hypothetical protein
MHDTNTRENGLQIDVEVEPPKRLTIYNNRTPVRMETQGVV